MQEEIHIGSTAAHFLQGLDGQSESDDELSSDSEGVVGIEGDGGQQHGIDEHLGDAGPENGPQSLSSITLAATPGMFSGHSRFAEYESCAL